MSPFSLSLLFLLFGASFTQFNKKCPPESSESLLDRDDVLELTQNDCDYRVVMGSNDNDPDFLDIYLEGNRAGWVAVGFSLDRAMGHSDVMGCKQDESGNVGVIDSWNGVNPSLANKIDPNQEGMCNYSSSYADGKFSCYFSRYYGVINEGFDYDLHNRYYILLGCSTTKSDLDVNFPYHQPNFPAISDSMLHPFGNGTDTASGKPTFEKRMIRAHGVLMVIAYPVLLLTAVFFAAWMKPTMPKMWFQVHRALTLASLVVSLTAFAVVFIANKNNPTPGIINLHDCGTKTTHFAFGIIAVFLHVLNPLIAIIRCKPDNPNRWIFNLVHGAGIGLLTEIIGLINIGLGAAIFQTNCATVSSTNVMLWLYIAWIVIVLGTQSFLYIYFTYKALRGEVDNAPLLVKVLLTKIIIRSSYQSLNEDTKSDPEESKADNVIRYSVLCFQLATTLIIALIMIVFIIDLDFE
ncbi:PREDICTED: putative ferric-chelate reductase 1 isoform X2 [Amphimedon queenslandica]|uniref:Cytochrome b561 domain-containing protein n=1 Tax=Amphimedon queenslandica TaxID=400682 RepID=A0AAN0JEF8_AMPQE|nr:PREDICTED: putative ferric-chelate reductase 1 isoform X2 [Amphimedon queenslandica]|eukprot:XP_019855379.1 PREDICTED: putative ferric-chelate reductase 1 isoform X2 [Amphimedon queenslandica]